MVFRERINHVTSRVIEDQSEHPNNINDQNPKNSNCNPSSCDDPRLVFEFIVTQKTQLVQNPIDQPEVLVGEEEFPLARETFRINPRFAKSENTVETTVSHMLRILEINNPNLHASLLQKISPDAFTFTKRAIESKPTRMMMRVEIVVVDVYEYDEGEMSTLVESAGEDSGFVPASKLSIQKLEKVTFNGEDSTVRNCVICLEDMEIGSQVMRMPCSHMFHGSCITSWLQINHVCPLCRFEMPILLDL